jgi:16S rRNA (guanine527-N7)-methyltransferase
MSGQPDVDETRVGQQILDLAARHGLPPAAADQLAALLDLVVTDPRAPTTVRHRSKVLEDHLADSLVALELPETRAALTIVDLGAGAGFPGLPLAIARPDAHVVLVESSGRKCSFISRAILACCAGNAEVVWARAESWANGAGSSDLVTARALASLEVVAEYAAPLLKLGGTLIAWRGQRDPDVEGAAALAADELGLRLGEIHRVNPYLGAEHRYLHLMSKVRDTPAGFPRRPGIAHKRPLGARRRAV